MTGKADIKASKFNVAMSACDVSPQVLAGFWAT
jgi:hypothetical protein